MSPVFVDACYPCVHEAPRDMSLIRVGFCTVKPFSDMTYVHFQFHYLQCAQDWTINEVSLHRVSSLKTSSQITIAIHISIPSMQWSYKA